MLPYKLLKRAWMWLNQYVAQWKGTSFPINHKKEQKNRNKSELGYVSCAFVSVWIYDVACIWSVWGFGYFLLCLSQHIHLRFPFQYAIRNFPFFVQHSMRLFLGLNLCAPVSRKKIVMWKILVEPFYDQQFSGPFDKCSLKL